jgi:hypothetical protein
VTAWTPDELARLDGADEMRVAGTRRDGSLRTPVIVWMVRLGDDLYTRSVNGPDAAWFRCEHHQPTGALGDSESHSTAIG